MSGEFLFVLSIDHGGRPRRGFEDLGASVDEDGDGVVDFSEVDCNTFVAAACSRHIRAEADVDVVTISHGEYSERHGWANRYRATAYLALHINSHRRTDINRGLFFHHAQTRRGNGDALATELARRWEDAAAELLGAPMPVRAVAATLPTWVNPHYTIKGLTTPVGICCEPFFLSNPAHRRAFATPAGLTRLGQVYGDALLSWARRRAAAVT